MSHATDTLSDAPAVEPTTESITADSHPPELPERKAGFLKRMAAEGTANEAEEFRFAELARFKEQKLGTQLARDLAWQSAMKQFPPADVAVGDEDEPEPEKEGELDVPHSEIIFDEGPIREELAELDRRCENQPVDLIRDVEWAYANMMSQPGSVRPLEAPSQGAFSQLQVAWNMGPVGYTKEIVNKVLLQAERKKNMSAREENDAEVQFERLNKLREGLGIPVRPLPDVCVGDFKEC